jgi:two-component system sensor histidine kinase and response regulator WspE
VSCLEYKVILHPKPEDFVTDSGQDRDDLSTLDLFRLEVAAQAAVLEEGLLALETQPQSPQVWESLMRAAHSVKGVARIVEIDAAVQLAHIL